MRSGYTNTSPYIGIARASLAGLIILLLCPLATQIHSLIWTVPEEVDPCGADRSTHWPLSSGWLWSAARNHLQEVKEWETEKSPTHPDIVPRCASPGIPLPAPLLGSVSGWAATLSFFCFFGSRSEKGFYCSMSQHTYWLRRPTLSL